MPDALSDSLLDHYGRCALPTKDCECLHPGPWLGRLCGNWRPMGVRSYEELRVAQGGALRGRGEVK